MKRYLLFYGHHYHPSGGINDLQGSFNDIERAKKKWEGYKKEYKYSDNDEVWCHILDIETGTKIHIQR